MALNLTLDPPIRLIVEPGYDQRFSGAEIASSGMPLGAFSAANLWHDPVMGVIMLKPRQLDQNFLNHQPQLDTGAVQRLATGLMANPTDLVTRTIHEGQVGSPTNPWIYHTHVATILPAALGRSPLGITASYGITGMAGQAEDLAPDLMVPLVDSQKRYAANVGFFFRWYVPRSDLVVFPTVYGLAVGQYFLLLRDTLVEVFQDVSPHGDRSIWQGIWRLPLFSANHYQGAPAAAQWSWGNLTPAPSADREHSLLIVPFAENKLLLVSQSHNFALLTTQNAPARLPDGSDWNILRSDSIQVWALSATVGRFQLQTVVYASGAATLMLDTFQTEYTPLGTPHAITNSDTPNGSTITTTLQSPLLYTFPTNPVANDCPNPTMLSSGQSRVYGATLAFQASADQLHTPQFYSLDIHVDPIYMDNPSPAHVVGDTAGGPVVMSADFSAGTKPGDGHLNAKVLDFGPQYALAGYYDRAEMPVQVAVGGTTVFTGYTERLTHRPLRQTGAPSELTVTAHDRWLLLETTYLRDQRDYTDVGHITVVDTIARQCGIDTTSPLSEYPAGWDGAMASVYNGPLQSTADLMGPELSTDQSLLGWKPQPFDTGATFLKRIADNWSGWLLGFRLDGTLYYLPWYYFTIPTASFAAHAGQSVLTGLVPTVAGSVGLMAAVSGGTVVINGQTVTVPSGSVAVGDNATSTIFVSQQGQFSSNASGTPPPGAVSLGTITAVDGLITAADTSAGSGRQTATTPVYRSPVDFRIIEPTGNVVQAVSHYYQDYSYNRSGLYVDWASVRNPAALNYLGRYKWFIEEINGAFNCPQINAMAWITFQRARQRRKRVVFQGDFIPTLKIGQVFRLEGYGNFRLLEVSAQLLKGNWQIATYTGEEVIYDYTAQATTGGEPTKAFAHAITENSRKISIEQFQKRNIRAAAPGRQLRTNSPVEANPKAKTQKFFTTGYDPITKQTVIPFTVGLSRVGGPDAVTH